MGRVTDSFTLLQRLAGSFEQSAHLGASHRRSALRWASRLGATSVPMCSRELCHASESRAAWAYTLLLELSDIGHGDKVRAALRKLAEAPNVADQPKLRVLALLTELGETEVRAHLADPEAIRTESMRKLGGSLVTQSDLSQAASMIATQLLPEELLAFLRDLAAVDARAGALFAAELTIRDDIEDWVRAELEPLAQAPLPKLRQPRSKRHSLVARHEDGHSILIAWTRRRKSSPPRYRSATALLGPSGELVEFRYGDDATANEIQKRLVGGFVARGFAIASEDLDDARDCLTAALDRHESRHHLPAEYYLGRDLFGLDLQTDLTAKRRPATNQPVLLARGFEAYQNGELDAAETLFRSLPAAEDSARAQAGLGLCALAKGELSTAVIAFERAVALEPDCAEHLWNLGAATHRRGCRGSCYIALSAFVDRAQQDDQRIPRARAFLGEFERHARLLHPEVTALAVATADKDVTHARRALGRGEHSEAEGLYLRATQRVSSHYTAWTELAQLRSRFGRLTEARVCARRALVVNPTYAPASQVIDFIASVERR